MTILVAGATGLAGSAIFRALKKLDKNCIGISSKEVNLLDRKATFEYICDLKPFAIIDAAAIVGGIGANDSKPVDFLTKNVQIQSNLMDAAHIANVERFVFLGSSCIYPRDCLQPMKEEYLMSGPLEKTNSAYAIAKIAGIELIKSYRKQFNKRWISLMPTNLYGPNDNFDLNFGHVFAVLIRRFVEASVSNVDSIVLWGTGAPTREFLHVDDLASGVLLCLDKYDDDLHINIGTGLELSIKDLALKIASATNYSGSIDWDSTKPDGTPRKVLDISRISQFGWKPNISLDVGISQTVKWYKENN
jgi:GDP-L-fucose synthase